MFRERDTASSFKTDGSALDQYDAGRVVIQNRLDKFCNETDDCQLQNIAAKGNIFRCLNKVVLTKQDKTACADKD
jgi:hypothetical protein